MSSPNNSIFPSPDILNDLEYGKFVLANLAAKRAKQLKNGAPPLVVIDSKHPLSIALAEIAAGKIKPTFNVDPESVLDGIDTSAIDDDIGNEIGILLPALDETEAELLGVAALVGDDHDEVDDSAEPVANLSDLVTEDDSEEDAVVEADDDTLSLSELADKEASEDDEPTDE